MNIPKDLKYTKDHEWIKVIDDHAVVGITDFASHELGDIVFVETEALEEQIGGGEPFGSIEAVKTVSDMLMPVSGTVLETNELLEDAPETVNNDPYGEGWIVKIKISDPSELDKLLSAAEYEKFISE